MDTFFREYVAQMRLEFAGAPHWVIVTRAEWHAGRQRQLEERVVALSRPGYNEAPRFTPDRWLGGCEVAYAWTGVYWRDFFGMLKHAFLAGVYGAMDNGGGEHHRYDGNTRHLALITGLTS